MKRWVAFWGISLALCACGKPRPRAPEDVVRQEATKKEPEFFDELEMTHAQRQQVLALIDQLYADFTEYDRTRLILLDETIRQIQLGQLQKEKLLPLAEVTITEFEKALPRGIEAMQRLHGILTKKQREEIVALFTEGRELSDEERRRARNNKISRVLGLTAGQKAKIYPALLALYIKHWGTIGRFRSALREAQDAFVEEHLVAKDLAIASQLELLALGEVIFDALEIGMNSLSREQHATLAALLDSQLRSPNPTKGEEEPALPIQASPSTEAEPPHDTTVAAPDEPESGALSPAPPASTASDDEDADPPVDGPADEPIPAPDQEEPSPPTISP